MAWLEIKNLHVNVDDIEILSGIDLTIQGGEVHALLGPNGHGKSTLLNVIMGHPKYQITSGEILLDGKDLLKMSVAERSRNGLFLALQYPQEIIGVTVSDFLRSAINAKSEKPVSLFRFIKDLERATQMVGFPLEMVHRSVNEGFSGGEKKRNEILQMLMLKPQIAMLDEIDSGLDVDALKLVASAINTLKAEMKNQIGYLIVSHYARMYDLVSPTHVHVVINGRIVASGNRDIIKKIDEQGYEWIKQELGIEIEKRQEEHHPIIMQNCAVKERKKNV